MIGSWFFEWLKYCARRKPLSDAGIVKCRPDTGVFGYSFGCNYMEGIWKSKFTSPGFPYDSFKRLTVIRIGRALSAHKAFSDRNRVLNLIVSTRFQLQRRKSDIKSYKNGYRGKSWQNWDVYAANVPQGKRIQVVLFCDAIKGQGPWSNQKAH